MSFASLIDELHKCVVLYGPEETLKILKEAQYKKIEYTDERVMAVVKKVCDVMNIAEGEIFYGKGRKNERRYAIGFCVYYLTADAYFHIRFDEVKELLKKENVQILYWYKSIIDKLDSRHTHDKKLVEYKNKFDQYFLEIVNTTKNGHNKN